MNKDKSSEPDGFSMMDGFSMYFYQICWDIIKDNLMKVFYEFFERCILYKGARATFIAHIPKKMGL